MQPPSTEILKIDRIEDKTKTKNLCVIAMSFISANSRDEKTSEERITHRGATTYFGIAEMGRPSKFASEEAKKSQIG